jgi:hypothetical protein
VDGVPASETRLDLRAKGTEVASFGFYRHNGVTMGYDEFVFAPARVMDNAGGHVAPVPSTLGSVCLLVYPAVLRTEQEPPCLPTQPASQVRVALAEDKVADLLFLLHHYLNRISLL